MDYKKSISWILVILWMGLIYQFSAQTATDSSSLSTGITDWIFQLLNNVFRNLDIDTLHLVIRKLAHLSVYLVLGVLLLNALGNYNHKQIITIFLALLVSLLYAISDEIHQIYVPGRSGNPIDVLIDFIGSTIGISIFLMYIHYNKKDN